MVPTILFGKNRIATKKTLDKIVAALKEKSFEIQRIDGSSVDSTQEILSALETPSLLGAKTAIILSYLSENKPRTVKDNLQAIKNTLSKTKAKLIIYEPYEKSTVIKQAKKWMWKVVEHKETDRRSLPSKINKKLREKGIQTSPYTGKVLAERTGYDENRLETEIEKLSVYQDDIEMLVPEARDSKVWNLINGMLEGDTDEISTQLKRLFVSGEDPTSTLHLIYQQLRKLALFISSGDVAELGVPQFAVPRFQSAAIRFSIESVVEALNYTTEIEFKIKTGQIDAQTGITLLGHRIVRIGTITPRPTPQHAL